MELTDEALIERYELQFENKKAVFVPLDAGDEVGLIVSMSTHNFGHRYFCLRSLLKTQRTNLLFITDPTNSYYLEKDRGASFQRLLRLYTERFGPERVTLFGSSMAGYGALYHGTRLNANIIASNPQIGFEATEKLAWNDLKATLSKVEGWVDLHEFLPRTLQDSVIYVSYGDYPMDEANMALLRNIPLTRGRLFFHKIADPAHGFYYKDQNQVFKVHELLAFARNEVFLRK